MSAVINLLPEARLVKLRDHKRKQLVTGILIFIALVVGTVIGTLLFLLAASAANEAADKNDISTLQGNINNLKSVEQTAADLQEHLDSFYSLNNDRLFASSIFGNLSNTIQPNVAVNSFEIADSSDGASSGSDTSVPSNLSLATIKGQADDYKAVSTFAKAIEEYNVNYKISRPDELQFHLEPGKPLFSMTKITSSTQDLKSNNVKYTMTFYVDRNLIKEGSPGTSSSDSGAKP